MTQDSAVWEGLTTGDAYSITKWNAPYSANRWSNIMDLLLAASYSGGFIVPGYGNNLAVIDSSPASMVVHLSSGTAFIRGRLYENTSDKSLTISANVDTDPRIDRVILTVDFAAHTIRSSILQGTPAAIPALPKLTKTSTIYEVSIAYIWVASGAVTITDVDIHDERIFASTELTYQNCSTSTNYITNSEFMGFSELSGGATTNPPDGWDLVATPSDIANYTKPTQMVRGRAVQITADGASEGISQTFIVKPNTTYAIKLLTRSNNSSVGSVIITTNSAAPTTITRNNRRILAWIEEVIFYTTENDATTMTVKLLALDSGDVVQYGQTLVVEGYIPGPYREIHETILFTKDIIDPLWDNTTPATVASSILVDYDIHFGRLILEGTKAIRVSVEILDTSASANTGYCQFAGPYGSMVELYILSEIAGLTYISQGWVALILDSNYSGDNRVHITSPSYGTMSVTIKLTGIHT